MVASKPKQGLDAAGFLLLAEGHLRKAKDQADTMPKAQLVYAAIIQVEEALNHARYALKLLKKQKEKESCKP